MKRTLSAALVAALFAAPAGAGAAAPPERDAAVGLIAQVHLAAADATAEAWRRWSEELSRETRASFGTLFGARMASGRVVKAAPYSAEVITETHQPLADGNVISRKSTGRVYRDGEGRTRQESGAPGKGSTVFIDDPVGGKSIVLNPDTRRAVIDGRAHVMAHAVKSRQVVRLDGTEVRVENGKVFIDGREVADARTVVKSKSGKEVKVENGKVMIDGREILIPEAPGSRVTVKRIDSGDGVSREEVRVQVVRADDAAMPPPPPMPPIPPLPPGAVAAPLAPLPPMPGVTTLRFESTARLGRGVTASLGTRDFDGVKAEGKSTTWTIPAGEIGNRNPIAIKSETWYSPELQVTVYSRYADPRTGESVYRLAGIRRGEPAADLFATPEGYAVKERPRERGEPRDRANPG